MLVNGKMRVDGTVSELLTLFFKYNVVEQCNCLGKTVES